MIGDFGANGQKIQRYLELSRFCITFVAELLCNNGGSEENTPCFRYSSGGDKDGSFGEETARVA